MKCKPHLTKLASKPLNAASSRGCGFEGLRYCNLHNTKTHHTMKDTELIVQTLQSLRPKVEEMLIRNSFTVEDYCPSQHHRCGQFLDSNANTLQEVLAGGGGVRMQFRKTQKAQDLALARTFRKIWEVCQLVQSFERGEVVEKSVWACGPFQSKR